MNETEKFELGKPVLYRPMSLIYSGVVINTQRTSTQGRIISILTTDSRVQGFIGKGGIFKIRNYEGFTRTVPPELLTRELNLEEWLRNVGIQSDRDEYNWGITEGIAEELRAQIADIRAAHSPHTREIIQLRIEKANPGLAMPAIP